MAQTGDMVRFLNSVGGGRIVRIEDNIAYVDEDGFETPVLLKECVVVAPAQPKAGAQSKYVAPPVIVPETKPQKENELSEETPEGEKLNVVLAYEPEEIKHLSTTGYDAYLVNDSNYYLYFTYLTRADGHGWITRFAGIVEPSIQVHLGHVTREMVSEMDRVAIQYVAFKRDREFKLKAPVAVEYAVDTTKFFKLHCFHDNIYFDSPVIAFDIVKNDIPQRPMSIDSSALQNSIARKKAVDRPAKSPVSKNPRKGDIVEVDLHVDELLDTTAGLGNADILQVQMKEFNRVMNDNLKNKGVKIVFIHGKGEGVLRNAILKELKHKYKSCDVQDASFREYGFGATQVTIR
ncbi:MAG TPA: DUF2027 domain-containing protein [Muribaculum sp.]|jgi:hypothetical protein|uniref:DUF2027 domain-containing protein n=1 Tax=Heminiphilus faecis TaxID=2601703 RepID=A0ABV4CYT1_9BACT|nr:DUF2027 domain-containing protein [Heminiphilus faecis]RLT75481.1 DUF2027 domain-containing protein [bacterium J10(2018)]HRF68437.1 DUF2027 domain-containing protein [Muribaculum sp.]